MDWKHYIQNIAMASSRKVGSLYRSWRFLTPETILHLYKSTIWPCMEYCSHLWAGAPKSQGLNLLDRVQKRIVNLVGSELSANLQPLSHRRDVASLSLFYKYYHGNCSSELADLVPPKRVMWELHIFLSGYTLALLNLPGVGETFIDIVSFLELLIFGIL